MQFDFEQFTKRFKRAYPVAEYARRKRNGGSDCGLFAYDDALEVFREYFLAYEYYTGTAHPQLKRERIIDIIQRMDEGETPETCPLRRYRQDPEFAAEYKRRCAELLETACTKAKSALPPAIERLNAIVQDDTQQPREQIAAARAVCEYSLRLNEAVDIEQRLRALEERSKNEP